MTETRIRWHAEDDGSIAAFTGTVGTIDPDVFKIYPPDAADAEWILTSTLPGFGRYRTYGTGPDELKADAERWLVSFTAALGAVFGDAVAADLRSHASELEAAVSADGRDRKNRALFAAGMRRAADLAERGDRPAVSTAPDEPAKEGQ